MAEKRSKADILVGSLNKKEVEQLLIELGGHKRATLSKLLVAMKSRGRSESPVSKSALFHSTYGEDYSPEKDYLIRNEMRLLSKEIMSFLAQRQVYQEIKDASQLKGLFYLKSLMNRGETELFEIEWPKILKKADAQLDHGTSAKILEKVVEHMVEHRKTSLADFEVLLEMINDLNERTIASFTQNTLYSRLKEAYVRRTIQAIGKEVPHVNLAEPEINFAQHADSDALSKYYQTMATAYTKTGNERLSLLESAMGLLDSIPAGRIDHQSQRAAINAAIALEYFFQNRLEESLQYHHQALERTKYVSVDRVASYLFNYVSTLIRLAKYQDAIDILDLHENTWNHMPRMRHRFYCLKGMCHVLTGNPDSAATCIPDDRKTGGLDHYYYFRVIQIIVQIEKGKVELALNECENVEHTVRYNDKNQHYLKLVHHFKRFIQLELDKPSLSKKAFKAKVEKLYTESVPDSPEARADHTLFYTWLHGRINQVLM